jgi:alanine racemase
MLYGSSPLPEFQDQLRAVMTWKARITLIREVGAGRGVSYGRTFITPRPMRIATIGAGYADGFRRHLSNRGAAVLIGGRRCDVLGRVTMDQILVDVTALPDVLAGDEAVLLGRQGDEEIFAADVASMAGTIPWDVFTGIGARVERVAV